MKSKPRSVAVRTLFTIGLTIIFVLVVLTFSTQKAIVKGLENQDFCKNQLHLKSFTRTELLFGLSKPNNVAISEVEFQNFIDLVVTPLFPDGLTVFNATGQFKNDRQTVVKENSKLLLLLYPGSDKSNSKIEQIRQAYKTKFQQESVLRVDARSCVSF
jgi:hypothetical protein